MLYAYMTSGKPVATAAMGASMAPVFDAPAEQEAVPEPMKDEILEQGDWVNHLEEAAQVCVTLDMTESHEGTQVEDVSITETVDEQEDSMCEAAEAQLLTEAGIEPIPADFAISPVKKQPQAIREQNGAGSNAPESQVSVEDARDDSVMEEVKHDMADPDTVQYPTLSESISEEMPNEETEKHHGQKPATPVMNTTRKVSYPCIDIFGLDEEEAETSGAEQAQTLDAENDQEADDEDEQSEEGETFAISLNDETVNLGALLSKNDKLSATITDDEIQLEMVEAGDEDGCPDLASTILETRDDESPMDSPDELSMDLDATETITTTGLEPFTHLDDDKAKLSSFLRRMAAAKEKKSTTVQRRESLQDKRETESRRDSDVVRKALASPRPVLEEKDKNLSPQRQSQTFSESTLNLDQILTSEIVKPVKESSMMDPEDQDELSAEYQNGSPRRRSSRTRSKLPQFPSQTNMPNRISVRTDGGEKVNLNRTEAQQLADIVRRNTKKNKGSSIPAPQRLAKLKLESLALITDVGSPVVEKLLKQGVKNVTWREQLADYATSIATADLEADAKAGAEEECVIKAEPKKKAGSGTPRLRKLKALGGVNGTPAKKVLQSIPLPGDEAEDEKAVKPVAASAANARKKRTIPTLAVATSASEESIPSVAPAVAPAQEEDRKAAPASKKSKLQQPKKLNLNPSLASIGGVGSNLPVLQGKENSLFAGLNSPAKKISKIPAPSGIPAPSSLSMDITSGLRPPVKRVRSGVAKKV
jgi:hypothetical protein